MFSAPVRSRLTRLVFSLLICSSATALAQSDDVRRLHAGSVIVAAPDYVDGVYGQSVILLTHLGPDGATGIMLNRKTAMPISQALSGSKLSSSIYLGGPVSDRAVLAIVKSSSTIPKASEVLRDVFVISDESLLESTFDHPDRVFRAYLGHCEWKAGELESEIEDGAWYIFAGRSQDVFDDEPESLWARLITQSTSKLRYAALIRRR